MNQKSNYEKSEWVKTEFIQLYVDNSEGFILERRRLLSIMKSFYIQFIKTNSNIKPKVLDLGCGNGILSKELLCIDNNIEITLLDGSEEMLKKAKNLLGAEINASYIKSSFQSLIGGSIKLNDFNLVVSSLAIHHLTLDEKKDLFKYIHNILTKGGAFINIDVVNAEPELETWYLNLWEDWIAERELLEPISKSQRGISKIYKDNPDNLPDTLETQLNALSSTGFIKVDCFYKYGIFSIFGGFK